MNKPPDPFGISERAIGLPLRGVAAMLDLMMEGRQLKLDESIANSSQPQDSSEARLPAKFLDNNDPVIAAVKMMKYVLAAAGEIQPEHMELLPRRPFYFNRFNSFDATMRQQVDMMLKRHEIDIPSDPTVDFIAELNDQKATIRRTASKIRMSDLEPRIVKSFDPSDAIIAELTSGGLIYRYVYDVSCPTAETGITPTD